VQGWNKAHDTSDEPVPLTVAEYEADMQAAIERQAKRKAMH
jgi:hypothetical protein